MGLCAPAILIPDVGNIIPGDEALPIPSFDYIGGRPKRAIQMIPLLAGLEIMMGMVTGMATWMAWIDIKDMSNTILVLQQQLDSLADVLQNR